MLSGGLPGLSPHTMAVRDWKGQVVFLHEVVPGSAKRSWGVHVAKLAGVPGPVVERASRLLKELERERGVAAAPLPLFDGAPRGVPSDAPRDAPDEMPVPVAENADLDTKNNKSLVNALEKVNPDELSPREALAVLYDLKKLTLEDRTSCVEE